MVRINQSFDGQEISVTKFDTFELSLAENPTTGYRWEMTSRGEPVCRVLGTDFDAGSGGLGSGGTRRWQFEVVKSGVTTIQTEYRREFEAGKPPAKIFHLTVRSSD